MANRHELTLTIDPGDPHVEFDVPGEITGEVRITVEKVRVEDRPPTTEEIDARVALADEMLRGPTDHRRPDRLDP